MDNNITKLVTTKSDTELAEEHKNNIIEAAKPLMQALTSARRDGFVSQLNFGEDAFKNITINHFMLLKQF